jgi:hypothetical protein
MAGDGWRALVDGPSTITGARREFIDIDYRYLVSSPKETLKHVYSAAGMTPPRISTPSSVSTTAPIPAMQRAGSLVPNEIRCGSHF